MSYHSNVIARLMAERELERLREALLEAATALDNAADRLNDAQQFASGSIAHNAALIAEDNAREALAGDTE